MAKKNRTDFGKIDFDSNLDFDMDFDFDAPKVKKSGKPIDDLKEGVKSSMRAKFMDPSILKTLVRKALPEGYSQAWDAVDTMVDDATTLYDQATKELRPHLGSISRKLDSMTPDTLVKTKRFTQYLKDKLSPELPPEYESYRQDNEDTAVGRMLADLELHRSEVEQARERSKQARELIKERVNEKRFENQQQVLGIIANEVSATRRYLTSYNIAYQKKSLELQYRSYATLAGIATVMKDHAKRSAKFQDALLLNTSLPEYAKTSNIQRWKQVTKEQVFGDFNKSFFAGNRFRRAGDRFLKRGKEKLADWKENFSMIDDALESALEAASMDKDMAEMEGRSSSGYRTAGSFLGSMGGEFLEDYIAGKIQGLLKKFPAFMKGSFTAGRMASNPGAVFDKVKNANWYRKLGASGELGEKAQEGLSFLMSLFSEGDPDLSIKNTSIGSEGENKLHTQMRVNRSLTDIIPGYLARILREVSILRTGNVKTGLLTFDYKTGHFKTETHMASDLMRDLRQRAASGVADKKTYAESVDDLTKTFIGKEELPTEKKAEVTKFLASLSRSNDDFDVTSDRIKTTKEFKKLSPENQKLIGDILDKRFGGDSIEAAGRQFRLATGLASTKSSIGNLMGPIQEAIRNGQGPMLAAQGLIRRKADGDWEVNHAAYYKIFDDTIGTSDVNMKTNIKPMKFNGQQSLNAIKNTELFSWDYKHQAGYSNNRAYGPMAQDVRANFGNMAAPGGKSVDLINLNGHTMAAVKKLSEMVESMGAGDGLKHLKNIDENTRILVEKGGLGGNSGDGGSGVFSLFGGTFGDLFGHAVSLGKGLTTEALKYGAKSAATIGKTTHSIGKAGNNFLNSNKENIVKARDAVMSTVLRAFTGAVTLGDKLVNETIPSIATTGSNILRTIKNQIKDIFHNVRDVYVAGRESPALEAVLIRAGHYRDQATNKVIETLDDISAAKGNIVNALGEVVLSIDDRAKGIFDNTGTRIRSFAATVTTMALGAGVFATKKASEYITNSSKFLGRLGGGVADKLSNIKSSVSDKLSNISGFGLGSDRRIVPVLLQIRDLVAIGKPKKRVAEILSRDIDKPYEPSKLAAGAIKEAIDSAKEKLTDVIKDASGVFSTATDPAQGGQPRGVAAGGMSAGNLFDSVRGFGSQVKDTFRAGREGIRNRFPGIGEKIANSRAGRAGKFLRNSRFGGWVGNSLSVAGSFLGGVGSLAGNVLGTLFGSSDKNKTPEEDINPNAVSAKSHSLRLAQLAGNKISNAYRRATGAFNDRNGDGQRDGGAADRMQDAENFRIANEERKKANEEAAKAAADQKAGRNKPEDDAIMKMIKLATAGLASITKMAGSIFGTALDFLGGGKGLLGLGKKAVKGVFRGVGKLGKAAVTGGLALGKGLTKLGGGIKGILTKVPGSTKLARVGATAVRAARVVGLAGAGGGSIIAGGLSLIGSALSSPLVIGTAAVAAIGYGGYKAYKYFTRDSIDEYQRLRFMQYGLDGTDATKSFNHMVAELEGYLLDGKLDYRTGSVDINGRSLDPTAIAEIFNINPDDSARVAKMSEWLEYRFKPVFLKHVGVLYGVDRKKKLTEVSSLQPSQLLDYLNGIEVPGIWELTTSPFNGLDVLNNNPQPFKDLLTALTKQAGIKVSEAAKKDVKKGIAGDPSLTRAAATEVTTGIPPSPTGTPPARGIVPTEGGAFTRNVPGFNQSVPANSRLGKALASQSEDGVNMGGKSGSDSDTMSFSGNVPKSAGGAIQGGERGMEFVQLGRNAKLDGMHPRMLKLFLGMAQEYGETTGKKIHVNQAFRSFAEQDRLWRQNPGKAARPGTSLHEYGLAMDISSTDMAQLEKLGLLRKYGFTRPVGGETWHMEPAGIQQAIQAVKKDPALADSLIAKSPGRGGGGLGSMAGTRVGRDPKLAAQLFNNGSDVTLAENTGTSGNGSMMVQASSNESVNLAENTGTPNKDLLKTQMSSDKSVKLEQMKTSITKYANEAGVDPNQMLALAAMESDFRLNAKAGTSSAAGPMQFVKGTWNEQMAKHGSKYGIQGADQTDLRASTLLASEYMKSNNRQLEKVKGAPLDITDAYMGHMFGAGGASRMLRAKPDDIAANFMLPDQVRANRSVFYDGNRPRTAAEVKKLLNDRIQSKAKHYGIDLNNGSAPDTATSVISEAVKPVTGDYGTGVTSSVPSFISNKDTSVTATGVGFEPPVSRPVSRVPRMNMLTEQQKDQNTQITNELFEHLKSTSTEQIKHLSSIDNTLTSIVPILERIAEHTQETASNVKSTTESSASKSEKKSQAAPPVRKRADSSSFDNRRTLTTV